MHVGILTGGGDCPGLNAVIRAVTLSLVRQCGARVTGIERGFHGLVERRSRPLAPADVAHILAEGGTILGTHNACDPFRWQGADRSADALDYARSLGLDALVVIGGDGTMDIAHRIGQLGLPVVGVPKTIDNDLPATERTFGFDSAVAVVAEALDRVATTARSHGRVMIVETMGRYAGWIALAGGMAGGADAILLPELPFSVDAVATFAKARERDNGCTLVCIAEGARAEGQGLVVRETIASSPDPLRLGGVGGWLQQQLQPRLDSEVRSTLLGHTQRGGTPTAYDRVLATRFGWAAAELVREGRFGRMVVLRGEEIDSVEIAGIAGRSRPVPPDHPLLRAARDTGVMLGH
ncbi:MAG: 6-phosphofructokinase [Pseudomonadota bacterium]|nr:ATP-dependent 6-phosphofructokinase [Rubrivivax sp.]MCA3256629.1 ATP-dependent 6-phosphofructokinase [Rubrivivax sp.]MCE2911632.1 ATP-dependent 6-phosphofructokinase [Rubrivivax sp.]MCZ8029184.1 ATP-dependent 6-phosphofructokinase [Rubrivivax sp.]